MMMITIKTLINSLLMKTYWNKKNLQCSLIVNIANTENRGL